MYYKTIVLEMIQQRPTLFARLRSSDSLISTMEQYANQLRDNHLETVEQLHKLRPGSANVQLSSEAMEIAVSELEQALPHDLPKNDEETFSLDAAMAYVRRHTPPA